MLPQSPPHRPARLPGIVSKLSLVAASLLAAAVVSEILLRALVPPSRGYYVLPPGVDWTVKPAPGVFPGVEGESHFRVNHAGVRGPAFGEDRAEYRILAVGGSTTRCAILDDTEVWTSLLETRLGRTVDGRSVWVGNVGRDGATTRDHVLHLKYLLPQYPGIDAVVALVGVNDMVYALQQGWQYRFPEAVTEPEAQRRQMPRAFAEIPGRLQDEGTFTGPAPWYKTTALWQLGRRAKQTLQSRWTYYLRDLPGQEEQARINRESAAEWVDSLPPLTGPLREFRRNLNTMADLAAAAKVRLVFVTQPSVWRVGMSRREEHLLSFGVLRSDKGPRRAFYTTRALARAMAVYNEALLDLCRDRGLECVDAARQLPRDSTAMYDEVHFNEHGSLLLADVLAGYFREHAPFRQSN